ncbi:hypothetical protein ALMP_59090 [Streptomyces sp. A012304]|nr:hypothetical protein ALMP_59090 [Streptomyces sp. A012304]
MASISRSEVLMRELYILVVTEIERAAGRPGSGGEVSLLVGPPPPSAAAAGRPAASRLVQSVRPWTAGLLRRL